MRIKPYIFGILVLVVFLGTILAFQAAGIWSISGKTTASGEAVQPSADDVNTIKGWMTLDQIVNRIQRTAGRSPDPVQPTGRYPCVHRNQGSRK